MTLGHNIVQRDGQFNSEESEVSFRDIFNSITSAFYGDYTFRLELAGHRHPPVDRYIEHFGEFTPSSFVVDQRGRPVFFARVTISYASFSSFQRKIPVKTRALRTSQGT